jgi:hypothetical protein
MPTLSTFILFISTGAFALLYGTRWRWIAWAIGIASILMLLGERYEIYSRVIDSRYIIDGVVSAKVKPPSWTYGVSFLPWLLLSFVFVSKIPTNDTVFWVGVGAIGLACINFATSHFIDSDFYREGQYRGLDVEEYTDITVFIAALVLPVWGPAFSIQGPSFKPKIRILLMAAWFVPLCLYATETRLSWKVKDILSGTTFSTFDNAIIGVCVGLLAYSAWKGDTITRWSAWISIAILGLLALPSALIGAYALW